MLEGYVGSISLHIIDKSKSMTEINIFRFIDTDDELNLIWNITACQNVSIKLIHHAMERSAGTWNLSSHFACVDKIAWTTMLRVSGS